MTVTVGGADFLQLSPAAAPVRGLTGWLADAIRAAIIDGRLQAGAPLPATRLLAGDLGVSRGVIVEAYQRLADEGLVSARPGAGTRVLGISRRPAPPERPDLALLPQRWRARAEIDLSPGVPDLSGFPRVAWLRAEKLVLEQASVADLGYGDPRGSQWLRTELAGWLARTRGLRADPDDIIVVTGVAQALALLAQVLRARAVREIAVEDPGSRGSCDELAYWGLRPVPVPVDEHGLQVDDLARGDLGAVLLTPAHQFPTGVVLAPRRRRDLLDWAAGADALIVEDDYDAEYRYDRAPVPALQASAPGLVAYAGSTSKTLAPGMRLGWLIPPQPAARQLGRGQARQRPGQPRTAAARAGPADHERRARTAHPAGPQAAAEPARRPAPRAIRAPARGPRPGHRGRTTPAHHVSRADGPGHRPGGGDPASRGTRPPAVLAPSPAGGTRDRSWICRAHP